MNSEKLVAPSILTADFSNLAQQIRYIELGGADRIHSDVMDGKFVPNITFGPVVIKAMRKVTSLPIDAHLMIQTPDLFLEDFKEAGSSSITVHQEAVIHLNRTLTRVRELGLKAGVAINPSTPVSTLSEIIGIVDFVLIMSVNPGFGGQKFISNSIRRIKELAELRDKFKLNFLIEIDGVVSNNNILEISSAGCNVFVIGNSIFGKDNITAATVEFKNLLR